MSNEVLVAIVTAGASFLVAIFSAAVAIRSQKTATILSDQLQERRAERDARRDYVYAAKQRLYGECDPVIFEALELAENARRRVVSLARAARHGDLSVDGSGWLAGPGYYFRSTAFYLLTPATSYKILQRRLTAFDLALEPRLQFQYELLKLAFNSYTFDHDLSGIDPKLKYDPDSVYPGAPRGEQLLNEAPQVYRRQGLYLGIVDQIADALVTKADGAYRCKSLGEFWLELDDPKSKLGRLADEIIDLYRGFHPVSAPILWRVLVAQYLIYGSLLRTRAVSGQDEGGPRVPSEAAAILPQPNVNDIKALDWRPNTQQATGSEAEALLLATRSFLVNGFEGTEGFIATRMG